MSVVIVTPTHVACDHMVISPIMPSKAYVDTNHRKFFVSPDNTFVYGTCGIFEPDDVVQSAYFDNIIKIFQLIIEHPKEILSTDQQDIIFKKLAGLEDFFITTDFIDTPRLLVSKKYRFRFRVKGKTKEEMTFRFAPVGDHCAIGALDGEAIGLLKAGLDLKTTFDLLSNMNSVVSDKFTSFEINNLNDPEEVL